eukprot:m.339213 g.339213  ORF g.339213 m.339213 type:complete len:207 (-) comp18709_c0_seq1:55-675(-)
MWAFQTTLMPRVQLFNVCLAARSLTTTTTNLHYAHKGINKARKRAERLDLPDPEEGKPTVVYGMRKNNRTSTWKMNLVAKQIRGMMVDDALAQLQFSQKRAAVAIFKVVTITKRNAGANHGVEDTSNMHVLESYVGRGAYQRGRHYHAQGRMGDVRIPKTHYYLKLQEGPPVVKKKDPLDKWYNKTKKDQLNLQKYPKKTILSLEN